MEKERRKYPRIDVRIPVELELQGGARVAATVLNLSRAGLQVTCDHRTVLTVIPGGQYAVPGEPVEVDARFALPAGADTPVDVQAHCKVVVAVRQAENDYRVGLEYVDFRADGSRHLDEFIERNRHGA